MKLKVNGFHALNLVLFVLVCVFLALTGINILSQADRQEKIGIIISYALFAILSMIIISGRYYSRSHALKGIPKPKVPISSSDLPRAIFEHIHSRLLSSMETKMTPILDEHHLPPEWELKSNNSYVDSRKFCIDVFSRLRETVEKSYPENKLAYESTTRHIQLLKEKSRLDTKTADRLSDIYQRARYSHHIVSSDDVKFALSSLKSLARG